MAVRQYIGARYVPKFDGTFDPTKSYEALTIVDDGLGSSYTSKIPVPPGTTLNDTTYWALTGSLSGAITSLQARVSTLEGEIPPIVNVRYTTPQEFGAVADGVTDDSAAIQSAIDDGRDVYIPSGTYYVASPLTLRSNLNIVGTGILLDATTNDDDHGFIYAYRKQNIRIEGITIKGTGASSVPPVDGAQLYTEECTNIEIIGCKFLDNPKLYCICFNKSEYVSVDRSYFNSYAFGGACGRNLTQNMSVTNSIFIDATSDVSGNNYPISLALYNYTEVPGEDMPKNLKATGNYIYNTTPMWEGIDAHAGENVLISDNIIINCYTGIGLAGRSLRILKNVVVADNVLIGPDVGTVKAANNYGIVASKVNGGSITGNLIKGFAKLASQSSITVTGGVYIQACNGLVFSNNEITDTGVSGYLTKVHPVYTYLNSNVEISNNNIHDNESGACVLFEGSQNNIVVHSNVLRNTGSLGRNRMVAGTAPYNNRLYNNDCENYAIASGVAFLVPDHATAAGIGNVDTGKIGDIVYNISPATGSPMGWVCTSAETSAGNDAIWKALANIA